MPRDPRKGLFRSKKIAFVLVIEWVFSFSELKKHVRTRQLVGGLCNWKKICRFVTNLVKCFAPRDAAITQRNPEPTSTRKLTLSYPSTT